MLIEKQRTQNNLIFHLISQQIAIYMQILHWFVELMNKIWFHVDSRNREIKSWNVVVNWKSDCQFACESKREKWPHISAKIDIKRQSLTVELGWMWFCVVGKVVFKVLVDFTQICVNWKYQKRMWSLGVFQNWNLNNSHCVYQVVMWEWRELMCAQIPVVNFVCKQNEFIDFKYLNFMWVSKEVKQK